jgi:hypothetical protein
MGWNAIGWLVAVGLSALGTAVTYLWPAAREFGFFLFVVGAFSFLIAALGAIQSGWPHLQALHARVGMARTMLFVSIIGAWIFLTLALGTAAWIAASPKSFAIGSTGIGVNAAADDGPLSWLQSFSMEGGMGGLNVFSIRFQGANISKESIELKSADITSLIDGTRLHLEIVGNDTDGSSKIVPLNRVQLIAPGAPIELVAKFGAPDPKVPGNILGLEPKTFLEKWRQFAFDATDDKNSYHFEFKENAFMPFFKGKVGPRVVLKPVDESGPSIRVVQ